MRHCETDGGRRFALIAILGQEESTFLKPADMSTILGSGPRCRIFSFLLCGFIAAWCLATPYHLFDCMEPDEATAATFTNIDLIAQWAGIDGARDNPQTPRGSLFRLLGLHGAEPPRIVAVLPPADIQAVLATWMIPADAPPHAPAPPTIAQQGQVGIFLRTCRWKCSILPAQLTPPAPPVTATPAPAAGSSGARKIKMAMVINQADDEEVDNLDQVAITQAYKTYRERVGGFPLDDEELSGEQLSTLYALFKPNRAPYTDMAVWGPFQHRIQKKIKMKGMRFNAAGEILPIEMYGPADFESWRECYMVFRTGAIMFEQISPAKLDMYEKLIRQYHERYGRVCWPIIYQADVRARQEQVERVRRRGQESFDTAQRAGLSHDFDPARPWEWVWGELTLDVNFWNREITEPCMLYLAKTSSINQLLDNDAPIAKAPPGQNIFSATSTTARTPDTSRTSTKRPRGPDVREHKVGEDGLYTHNRRGIELCKLFQSGECVEKDQRGACARNSTRRHQCAKCLSDHHGASKCPSDGPPRPPRQNHGKGKGKSKGKK